MLAIATVVLVLGMAGAGSRADQPPETVLAQVRQVLADGAGDEPASEPPRRMFTRLNVSDDGVPDWRADFEASGATGWCGTGGCKQMVFVSRPGGAYAVAFDEQVREMKLTRRNRDAQLDVDIYGGFCGRAGGAECRRRFAWNEGAGQLEERANGAAETRLHGPLFQPVEKGGHDEPPAVAAAMADIGRACGGKAGDAASAEVTASSVPDLNGDGVRDWVVGSEESYCAHLSSEADQPLMKMVVLLSRPGGFDQGLTLPSSEYEVDIAATPAVLVQLHGRSCHRGDKACSETRWSWDPAQGGLRSHSTP